MQRFMGSVRDRPDSEYESPMSLYSKLKEAADHIVTWAAFIALLTAGLAWLSSHLTIMKGANWADFIFVGVFAASLITLALAGMLAAWRYFNPVEPEYDPIEVSNLSRMTIGPPPISTPELARELRDRFTKLEAQVSGLAQIASEFENSNAKQIARVLNGIREEFRTADSLVVTANEARVHNLEQAYLGQLGTIRTEVVQKLAKTTEMAIAALHFVVQQSDAILLEKLISLAPVKALEDKYSDVSDDNIRTYLRTATDMLLDDKARLKALSNARQNAEYAIDEQLKVESRRHPTLDPYLYRERAIRMQEFEFVYIYLRQELEARRKTMMRSRNQLGDLYERSFPGR